MRESVFVARMRAKRKEARGLVLLVARVLSVGLSLLVASAAIRASAGLDDPAPQGEPPVEEATEEVQSREQRMLRQAVFRDRNIQCALDERRISPANRRDQPGGRTAAASTRPARRPLHLDRVRTSPGERSTSGRRSAERRRRQNARVLRLGCTQPKRSACSNADSPRLIQLSWPRWLDASSILLLVSRRRIGSPRVGSIAESTLWRFARGGCLRPIRATENESTPKSCESCASPNGCAAANRSPTGPWSLDPRIRSRLDRIHVNSAEKATRRRLRTVDLAALDEGAGVRSAVKGAACRTCAGSL